MARDTYQARLGERTFELALEGGTLTLDGTPVEYSFEPLSDHTFSLVLDGRSVPVVVERQPGGALRVTIHGRTADVEVKDATALLLEKFGMSAGDGAAEREVHAPMPGLVLRIAVAPGQAVQKGDGLLVLEAMKMENELKAPADATVAAVHVAEGDAVGKNALLIEFDA